MNLRLRLLRRASPRASHTHTHMRRAQGKSKRRKLENASSSSPAATRERLYLIRMYKIANSFSLSPLRACVRVQMLLAIFHPETRTKKKKNRMRSVLHDT